MLTMWRIEMSGPEHHHATQLSATLCWNLPILRRVDRHTFAMNSQMVAQASNGAVDFFKWQGRTIEQIASFKLPGTAVSRE